MFDLEHAIGEWKKSMRKKRAVMRAGQLVGQLSNPRSPLSASNKCAILKTTCLCLWNLRQPTTLLQSRVLLVLKPFPSKQAA